MCPNSFQFAQLLDPANNSPQASRCTDIPSPRSDSQINGSVTLPDEFTTENFACIREVQGPLEKPQHGCFPGLGLVEVRVKLPIIMVIDRESENYISSGREDPVVGPHTP
ncbi:hypothetical protein Pelo_9492 [Pelomyxa schiedti]|nr:hypothetical protein Pelo_9492 [Pelomyxa schiedti]